MGGDFRLFQKLTRGLLKAHRTTGRLRQIDQLPRPERYNRPFEIISFKGESQAGKTTILKELGKPEVQERIGCRISIVPEFTDPKGLLDFEEFKKSRGVRFMDVAHMSALVNLQSFNHYATQSLDLSSIGKDSVALQIFERGPHDVFCWAAAVLNFYNRPFSIPEMRDFLFVTRLAFEFAVQVDAVVDFSLGIKEATNRRVRQDLPRYGYVVNPEVWPYYRLATRWWRNSFYPFWRESIGVGSRTIRGENPPEENLEAVINYLQKLVNDRKQHG